MGDCRAAEPEVSTCSYLNEDSRNNGNHTWNRRQTGINFVAIKIIECLNVPSAATP